MRSTRFSVPTADQLAVLAQPHTSEVVTLLLPPGPSTEARLTLRNLIKGVEDRLVATMRPAELGRFVAPLHAVVEDHEIWREPVVAMSLYLDDAGLTTAVGPTDGVPFTVIAPRFQVAHLFGAHPSGRYAVLVLTRGTSHLYRGRGERITETKTEGLPAEMATVLRYDDREPQLQSHGSARRGGGGQMVGAFHGQGGKGDHPEDAARYLRFVAAEVEEVLGGEPLVLAATTEMAAAYRRIAGYRHIVDDMIPGNVERKSPTELAQSASHIVAASSAARRHHVIEEFRNGNAAGSVVNDPGEVLTGAYDGRVEQVAIARDRQMWGRYDMALRRVASVEHDEGAVDLLNEAAAETWLHGGEVLTMDASEVPGPWPMAALMRF